MVKETEPSQSLPRVGEALKAFDKQQRQFYWRTVYETGKDETGRNLYPYSKEKPPMDFKPFDEALDEANRDFGLFLRNFGTHLRKVDAGIRGRDAGGVSERLQREGILLFTMATVVAFDLTSGRMWNKGLNWVFLKRKDPTTGQPMYASEDVLEKSKDFDYKAARKFISVANDKYPAGFLDWGVSRLTGEKKAGFVKEATDRIGDAANIIASRPFEDVFNGAMAECLMRMAYQIPVGGALLERAWTELTTFIEKSQLRKSTAKAVFRSIAVGVSYYPDFAKWKKDFQDEKIHKTVAPVINKMGSNA